MELQDSENLEFDMGGLDIGPDGDGECLEDDTSLAGDDHTCSICMDKYHNPRVLSCLHTFCLPCLEKMQKMLMDESGDGVKTHKNIQCPKCKQETKVGSKGVASLPIDHVMCNMLEMSAITCSAVKCQSCKTKEPAVARCADCANCLCANCNSAHEFMHRFEKHEVVKLEDLCAASGESVPIHASIVCKKHSFANMTYYCHTCQMPMCNSCALEEHASPDHHYESLAEAEPRLRENIQNLTDETMAKGELCVKTSNVMTNELQELQAQTDNARSSITEALQSYKTCFQAIVEKYCQELQEQLMNLHHTRELKIMESFHILDCTQGKIDSAAKFATRLLKNGNMVELASLNGVVVGQLQNLIDNIPKPEIFPAIEFKSNLEEFESGVKAVFGSFRGFDEPEAPPPPKVPTPGLTELAVSPSSSVSMPASMQSSMDGSGSRQSPLDGPLPKPASQVESPVNIHSSVEQAALASEIHPPQGFSREPPVSGSSLNLTCMGEYNLQQLASLSTPNSTSPNPPFPFPEPYAGSNSTFMKNLEALAQVGHATVNGTSPSPPATLGSLMNDVMMSDHMANGIGSHGAMILGRASPSLDMNVALMGGSPGVDMMNSMRTSPQGLEINTTMGNITLRSLSGTPSPILSQPDTMDLESMRSLSLSTVSMNSINSFQPRAMNGKLNPMQIRCKYGQLGPSKAQFNSPHGFCLGADEDIIVADTNNHRIQIFDKNGAYKFQFGIPGKEEGQLWYPRKVAVMRSSGKFVVCDRGNERSRMQIFTRNGHFVKKIAIRYVDIVAGLAVTVEGNIVAVDSVSPTVFVISESGELIRWFDCSDHMREPSDIAINGNEYFVCDFKGHCVVVFSEEGTFLRRIGCESITNFPNGIDISDAGDVLVGDSHGNRFHVAVFTRDGSLLSEFECPYVKVSRCCGLKITSEGYIVTLAKNNHHVLILNTLYIV